jgi:hypothetical protein
MLEAVLARFEQQALVSVMARVALERAIEPGAGTQRHGGAGPSVADAGFTIPALAFDASRLIGGRRCAGAKQVCKSLQHSVFSWAI